MTKLNYHDQAHWPNGFGRQQSPIALQSAQARSVPAVALAVTAPYQMQTELDDDTTIKLLGQGRLTIGARAYDCVQVHFHVPVEHTGNPQAVLEVHLVHQTALGQLCVVAVRLVPGAAAPALTQVIAGFDQQAHPMAIDLSSLIPQHGHVFHYLGSLTTPPLTEGVEWYVIDAPTATVSAEQIAWFKAHYAANSRISQPLADRVVEQFNY
ncbi:carbonic anhydrase family protein [Lacticaseibacillus baoqingensis]|uniref:carbonic anhydrase n=1 Tax=Lacticaseibacillus baoqingensis TaxID=2486013 RepID=A0ABW4E5L7_9LACO|nr:carbonic anhydrase family protein [Lacticaseibacillus baoqingensis]